MEGLIHPGSQVWVSRKRTAQGGDLKWTWEFAKIGKNLVCTNSWAANEVVFELLQSRRISGLGSYTSVKREIRISRNYRVDFAIESNFGVQYLEVKSVQQATRDGTAYFPDSVAKRSQLQLGQLARRANAGQRCVVVFVVLRSKVKKFWPSAIHDPNFFKALITAHKKGVRVFCLSAEPTVNGFKIRGRIPFQFEKDQTEIFDWSREMKPFSGWSRPPGDACARWRRKGPKADQAER